MNFKKPKEFKTCNKYDKFRLRKDVGWADITGKTKSRAPSLDRIIPSEGYARDNIVVVYDIVNRLKSDASLDDMKKILSFYSKYEK